MKFKITKPSEMSAADSWLPILFCGLAGRVANKASHSSRLIDLATDCIDGWRTSSNPDSILYDSLSESSPKYRQANIDVFFLNIEIQHCLRPIVENRPYCVSPGDIVIPKIPPLHASFVSSYNHRHPIDGNCFLIRGMNLRDAAWLLFLFNEKEFEAWFIARSGSQVLPRIGLKDLRNCPFPDPPERNPEWSTRLINWIEKFSINATRLFSLESEVHHHVSECILGQETQELNLFNGVRVPAILFSDRSWLPSHIENEYQQKTINKKGMLRLKELVLNARFTSSRLKKTSEPIQILRIADVTGIFLPSVMPLLPETRLGRFFAEPVRSGEVLLSSLVTSPKVVYADPTVTEKIHPIDHWIRLFFKETPGAWALVLSSPALGERFRSLATGSARQFTKAKSLMDLYIPYIESNLRVRWQKRLDEILAERRCLDEEWKTIRLEGRKMVADVLEMPWSEMQERSLK